MQSASSAAAKGSVSQPGFSSCPVDVGVMGTSVPATGAAASSQFVAKVAQTGGDVFAGFCKAVASYLAGQGSRLVLLSKVASTPLVQAEWAALQRVRAIGKNTKMKQVLMMRKNMFEVLCDSHRNEPYIRLVINAGAAIAALSFEAPSADHISAVAAASAAIAVAAGRADATASMEPLATAKNVCQPTADPAVPLRPEQISAIEAHLHRSGGKERYSIIRSMFGVKQAQLRAHFTVLPVNDDAIVLFSAPAKSAGSSLRTGPMDAAVTDTIQGLEQILTQLKPSRMEVGDAMAFCLERAEKHAALLSRRVSAALGEVGLDSASAMARLYLVNDILHNAGCGRPGASQFRQSLQELLPEACEQLGRSWLRRLESLTERTRMENAVRKVLSTWENWAIFPSLFIKGLEALLFSPVLATTADVAGQELDPELRRKLLRWFSAGDQARLPYAARLRGLSGKSLPTISCRDRLCHFERYWHRPEVKLPENDADPFEHNEPSSVSSRSPAMDAHACFAQDLKTATPHLGAAVRIEGAKAVAGLRGALGVCEAWDAASGHWTVRLDNGSSHAVAPENLVVLGLAAVFADDGEPLSETELQVLKAAGQLCEDYEGMGAQGMALSVELLPHATFR
eukprot:TRINITY_DN103643_c0_g1_i1.p1 TRINITY_DN103643_c0_g1~~TRINITY_DN103643_c0_g1_i1.p1  ORF type:complete len:626 (-),score=118.31 TRINITY_DN103643_c0_g1_i1:96-1973(-)